MQPYENVRVLDFTHVLAGPFATYQLAVLGADVIKIEPPHRPDMMREEGSCGPLNEQGLGVEFLGQSSNKRAMSLDLGQPVGRDIALRLAASADVLVENYSRGVMESYGLGPEAVRAINPRLIYCTITGYGHTGPKADHPAYDLAVQAFSGLMAATGTPDSGPVRVGPPVLDYGSGAQAAFAISSALFQRSRTGVGQRIDVSMLDAAIMMMSMSVMSTQSSGEPPRRAGNLSATRAGYSCYWTADGLLAVAAFTARQHARLWRALGRDDLADEVAGCNADALAKRHAHDYARLAELFRTRSADEWETLLNEAHVPAARVRSLDESLAHPQVASRGLMQDCIAIPDTGAMLKTPVAAFGFEHGGPSLRTPPPVHGKHTAQILSELGFTREEIAGLSARGVT